MSGQGKTGEIWNQPPRSRGQIVRRVCERLENEYGRPRHGNPDSPVDDLIYILLSNRTTPVLARAAYQNLKDEFPDWRSLLEADWDSAYVLVKRAGFGEKRTNQIRGCLKRLVEDFGGIENIDLWDRDTEDLLDYLTTLPGVSGKVARCIAMYTLDRDVLPVDVHVFRIASRLGWVDRNEARQCHKELEALIPPHRYFAFHVDCIAHGRKRCFASNPDCNGCVIRRYCNFPSDDESE